MLKLDQYNMFTILNNIDKTAHYPNSVYPKSVPCLFIYDIMLYITCKQIRIPPTARKVSK